jgi:carboxymethylenebutenolidase
VAEKVHEHNPEVEVYWYEAGHAFSRDADSNVYVPEAAQLARERSLNFLKKNLA